MDRTGASFWRTVGMIKDRLNAVAVPIQLPIGMEQGFKGIIDLIENKAYLYTNDLGTDVNITDPRRHGRRSRHPARENG